MSQSLSQLQEFSNNALSEDLPENCDILEATTIVLAKAAAINRRTEKSRSRADPSVSELMLFLKKHLEHEIANFEDWTLAHLKHEFEKNIAMTASKLEESKYTIQQLKEHSELYETHVIDFLRKVEIELAATLGLAPDVTNISFDLLTASIANLVVRVREDSQVLESFREFLASFLSQIVFAVDLPVIKFNGFSLVKMKSVMISILDSPEIQRKLGRSPSGRPVSPRAVSHPPQREIISTKDADTQFALKIHNFLAESCGQLNSSPLVTFMHFPIDKLMATLTKSIYEKLDLTLNLRGLIADALIRVSKRPRAQKEAVMKLEVETLARELFSQLENQMSLKGDLTSLKCLIHPLDQEQYEFRGMSPFDCIKAELQRIAGAQAAVAPFVALLDSLITDLSKSRNAFLPLSPYFSHFIGVLDDIKQIAKKLTPQDSHPLVFDLITKSTVIIIACGAGLSSVSFTQSFTEAEEKLSDLISTRLELSDKIRQLETTLAIKDHDLAELRTRFAAFATGNKAQSEDQRKRLADFHAQEVTAIIDYYSQSDG
jgi:hypothetical protein